MAENLKDYSDLPEKTEEKIKQRAKKMTPKMKVSGRRVFQLKQILKKKQK